MPENSIEQTKIVVADDEVEALGFLTKILKHAGYAVYPTPKGKEVLALVESVAADLIILDILMPDMRGEEIAANLAQKKETSNIPLIFLTGLVGRAENAAHKIRGKYYILAKPVMVEELLETIRKALAERLEQV